MLDTFSIRVAAPRLALRVISVTLAVVMAASSVGTAGATARTPVAGRSAKAPAAKKPASTSVCAHVLPTATRKRPTSGKRARPQPVHQHSVKPKAKQSRPSVQSAKRISPVSPVASRGPTCAKARALAPLPVLAAARGRQPGPISTRPDPPLVPTVAPLGRTPGTYFGTHVFGPGQASAWPGPRTSQALGSVRLWDTGTAWSDLQPAPGMWVWDKLDVAVGAAVERGYQPLLVLGQTPTWASSDPSAPGFLQPGGSVVPESMGTWRAYVTAVAARYAGRIAAYEVWNEPNYVGDYFHGSESDMAELSAVAYDAVKAADPSALVISPGMATRTHGQAGWIFRYFDQPKARRIDAISLHLYPRADELPEAATQNLASIAAGLAARGLRKPVWNTEVNYGVVGGTADAIAVPEPLGSAYVARTLIMDRAAGVDRVFWYGWAQSRLLGIGVSGGDDTLTAPAQAWVRLSRWLSGATLVGCADTDAGYACSLLPDSGGWAQVLWQPDGERAVRASAGTTAVIALDGTITARAAGERIVLSPSPVLVVGGRADVDSLS